MWNKFTRGEALIDVVIGTTLIGFFVISTFNVLLGILKESGQITKRIQANWVANGYMEQITHFPFTDPDDTDPEDGSDRDDVDDFDDYSVINYGLTVTVNVNDAEVNAGTISISESPLDNPDFKQVRVTISDGGLSEPIELKTLVALDQLPPILESIRLSETYNADGEGDFLFDERVFSSTEVIMSIIATFTEPVMRNGGDDSDITMTLTNIRETIRDDDESPFVQSDEDLVLEAVLMSDSDLDLEANQLEFQLSLMHPDNPDGDIEGNSHYSSPDIDTFVAVASINYGNDQARLVAKDDLGQPQVNFEAVLDMPSDDNSLLADEVMIFMPPMETQIYTDYDLFKTLIEEADPPPTFEEIFQSWSFFDDHWFSECLSPPCQNSNDFTPTKNSCMDYWILSAVGTNNERVEITENTYWGFNGIVSPETYSNYVIEATMASSDGDNDMIALVLAFVRDEETNKNYHISAMHSTNGVDPCTWGLVAGETEIFYHAGNKRTGHTHTKKPGGSPGSHSCSYFNHSYFSNKGINSRPKYFGLWGEKSENPGYGWSSSPPYARVKITRDNNVITAQTSGFNTSRQNALDDDYHADTYISLDLETGVARGENGTLLTNGVSGANATDFERFLNTPENPCCSYGYGAYSQRNGTFYDRVVPAATIAFGQYIYLNNPENLVDDRYRNWSNFTDSEPDYVDAEQWLSDNEERSQIWKYNDATDRWEIDIDANTIKKKLGWMRIVTSTIGEPSEDDPKKSFLILE